MAQRSEVIQLARRTASRLLRRLGLQRIPVEMPPGPAAEPVPAPPAKSEFEAWYDELPVRRPEPIELPLAEPAATIPDEAFPPVWPWHREQGDRGQLTAVGQAEIKDRFGPLTPELCRWYHEVETPDGRRISGAWDLIGAESTYLGDPALEGKRVFELGPASGHLTRWMELAGAEVVSFDIGMAAELDLIAYDRQVGADQVAEAMRYIASEQRSWWYHHDLHDLDAKIVYGSIYDPPADLGEFEVSTLSAVLLHLQSPFHALRNVAAFTTETIILTEMEPPRPWSERGMMFNPAEGQQCSWWMISPEAAQRMLSNVGFPNQSMTRHIQRHRAHHVLDDPPLELPMYTIVAQRN